MGGGSYDRDTYSTSSSAGWGAASSQAQAAMSSTSLALDMHPKNKRIKSDAKHPIIIALDVTGSNTTFAKIVYDKMPMFFGQIEQQGYLKDFDIALCAVGDANSDRYPLQVSDFAKGTDIDICLKKLVLEGNGGGQQRETYELAAYYMLHNVEFRDDAEPFIFFLGDESYYGEVEQRHIMSYVDNTYLGKDVDSVFVFKQLLTKFKSNAYMFLNPYNGSAHVSSMQADWNKALPTTDRTHVILMEPASEKAIIDLMLGVIAMASKNRSLSTYKMDMLARGQTQDRITGVDSMLGAFSKSLALVPTNTVNMAKVEPTTSAKASTSGKSTRI